MAFQNSLSVFIWYVYFSAATIYEPIGMMAGEKIFLKENLRFKLGSTTFSADLLYTSRDKIYLYRNDLDKVVKLEKEEVTLLTPWQ